jgi:hypothetical protein
MEVKQGGGVGAEVAFALITCKVVNLSFLQFFVSRGIFPHVGIDRSCGAGGMEKRAEKSSHLFLPQATATASTTNQTITNNNNERNPRHGRSR